MNILRLIASDSFITVNKELIKLFGLESAVLIGELASEYDYWAKNNGITPDGYFFSTIENIEEKTGLSEHRQRQAIKKLEEQNIVSVKVKGLPAKRYIKLDEQNLVKLFEASSEKLQAQVSENSETCSVKIQKQEPEKFKRNNNINNNNISIINNKGDASSPSDKETEILEITEEQKLTEGEVAEPSTPPKEKPKRQSRKDQLIEFVNSLNYCEETKQELLKWIFQIGLKGNLTIEQLKDKLAYIHNIYSDEARIRESIKNAYLNNWFGFFPINKPTPVYKTPATPKHEPCTPPAKKETYTPTAAEIQQIMSTFHTTNNNTIY